MQQTHTDYAAIWQQVFDSLCKHYAMSEVERDMLKNVEFERIDGGVAILSASNSNTETRVRRLYLNALLSLFRQALPQDDIRKVDIVMRGITRPGKPKDKSGYGYEFDSGRNKHLFRTATA